MFWNCSTKLGWAEHSRNKHVHESLSGVWQKPFWVHRSPKKDFPRLQQNITQRLFIWWKWSQRRGIFEDLFRHNTNPDNGGVTSEIILECPWVIQPSLDLNSIPVRSTVQRFASSNLWGIFWSMARGERRETRENHKSDTEKYWSVGKTNYLKINA